MDCEDWKVCCGDQKKVKSVMENNMETILIDDKLELNDEQKKRYLEEKAIIMDEQQRELNKHLEMRLRDAKKLKEDKNYIVEVKFKKHDHNKSQEKRYRKIYEDVSGIRWDHVDRLPQKSRDICINYMVLSYNHILRELMNGNVVV